MPAIVISNIVLCTAYTRVYAIQGVRVNPTRFYVFAQLIELLLQNGAEASAVDLQRNSPLHYAAIENRCSAIEELLSHESAKALLQAPMFCILYIYAYIYIYI